MVNGETTCQHRFDLGTVNPRILQLIEEGKLQLNKGQPVCDWMIPLLVPNCKLPIGCVGPLSPDCPDSPIKKQ